MLRVLHSVSNMQRAGLETMLMNYYRRMDRSVVQFDFLCNKPDYGEYEPEVEALGGRIYHSPGLNPIRLPKYMKFMEGLFAESPDTRILHAHNESMALYALCGAKRSGCPVRIFHSHNTSTVRDYKYPLKMVCKSLLKYAYTDRWACGVDAGRYYFGDAPAHILHNAIDLKKFAYSADSRAQLRREYGLEGRFVVGHIGRFCAQKNQPFLIEAFRRVYAADENARLVLIGTGETKSEIEGRLHAMGIADRVVMPGSVDNTYAWYSAIDVFAMPSVYEGLPVVGIEAQASGLKTLFSDAITQEARALDSTEYLPLDMDAWVRAMLDARGLERDGDGQKRLREKGYDIDVEAPKLQEIYLELIKNSRK